MSNTKYTIHITLHAYLNCSFPKYTQWLQLSDQISAIIAMLGLSAMCRLYYTWSDWNSATHKVTSTTNWVDTYHMFSLSTPCILYLCVVVRTHVPNQWRFPVFCIQPLLSCPKTCASNLTERRGMERSFSEWSVCPERVESRW